MGIFFSQRVEVPDGNAPAFLYRTVADHLTNINVGLVTVTASSK